MIKNTAHSSIGCNGMANNDDYHGLEMYKTMQRTQPQRDICNQTQPTWNACGRINP